MKFDLKRTIVALSSGAMPGQRSIVRLSGATTCSILSRLFQSDEDRELLASKTPHASNVTCSLQWPNRSEPSALRAVAYYWPDARSFTGEPCAELHIIGSMPVAEALIAQLCSLGAHPANRGEFTLRSFLAGKLDLIQAEAVLGVIEAEDAAELRQALEHLGGNLSRPVKNMRSELIELIAHLEAGLDFVEEDIEFISSEDLIRQLQQITEQIDGMLAQLTARDARAMTAQVLIVGLPNAGKSSLFNFLVARDRAIISPLAGTTRDVISQHVQWDETSIELIDSAGFETLQEDSPRAAAQQALNKRLQQADVALLCVDSSSNIDPEWVSAQVQALVQQGITVAVVGTKSDLLDAASKNSTQFDALVSVHSGEGCEALRALVLARIGEHNREFQSAAMQHIAIRCRQSLQAAQSTLQSAIELAQTGDGEELVASELRIALDDLSAVIGEVHSDDILGEIFSHFCIGK